MPKSNAPPLLEIHNATVWRGDGDTPVFSNFSLTIPQGQNVAVLGPNGAGKTTLLRLLTRELYPVASADAYVRILGQERWNVRQLRQHLGLVSHDLQVDYAGVIPGREVVLSGFAASEGIRHVSYAFSAAESAAAATMMERLGIEHLAETPYGRMSTGEQRRLLLARALVNSPHTLVLDEPMAGLDLRSAFICLTTLQALMQQGIAVLLVTHHVDEIPPAIERIILLDRGKIIADGPKRDVLTAANLATLYQTDVRLIEAEGYFIVRPAAALPHRPVSAGRKSQGV